MSDLLGLRESYNTSTAEFLAREHSHLTDSLLSNEEGGEKRVNVYFALIAAVTAALGLSDSVWLVTDPAWIVLITSSVLLMYGLATLRRLIGRNLYTTELVNGLRRIRAAFVWSHPEVLNALPFVPEENPVIRARDGWGLEKAGYVEVICITDAFLFGIWTGSIVYLADILRTDRFLIAAIVGLVTGMIAWFVQIRSIRTAYARRQNKRQEDRRDAIFWWNSTLQTAT